MRLIVAIRGDRPKDRLTSRSVAAACSQSADAFGRAALHSGVGSEEPFSRARPPGRRHESQQEQGRPVGQTRRKVASQPDPDFRSRLPVIRRSENSQGQHAVGVHPDQRDRSKHKRRAQERLAREDPAQPQAEQTQDGKKESDEKHGPSAPIDQRVVSVDPRRPRLRRRGSPYETKGHPKNPTRGANRSANEAD